MRLDYHHHPRHLRAAGVVAKVLQPDSVQQQLMCSGQSLCLMSGRASPCSVPETVKSSQ